MKRWLTLLVVLSVMSGSTRDIAAQPVGRLVEGMKSQEDPSETYTLYLPPEYETSRRWPVLLIFDPRGRSRSAAEVFVDAAEEYGWILVSSDGTRSDGPAEPNIKALNALWPEIHERYAIDPKRIYASGFSGGAMVAWALGRGTGALAGVIASGGRLAPEDAHRRIDFATFGAAGDADFNYNEMRRVHERLRRWGTPERLEFFPGFHRWMPAELGREAIEWMEIQAIREERRPADDEFVDRIFAHDMDRATALESSGDKLAAMRRFENIVSTYDGLVETGEAEKQAAKLGTSRDVKATIKDQKRWDRFEESSLDSIYAVLGRLEAGPGTTATAPPKRPISATRLASELRIEDLRTRAAKATYEGSVARRLLGVIGAQTTLYMVQKLFGRRDYATAVPVLTVATQLRPDRADVWYNLACALAQSGSEDEALTALEQAVAKGFTHPDHIEKDPDLEPIRESEGFRAIVSGLRATAPRS